MSVDVKVYVGPVLRCEVKREPMFDVLCNTSGCNSRGRRSGQGSYCSFCGKAFQRMQTERKLETIDYYGLTGEAFTSSLSPSEEHRIFVPNQERGSPRQFMFDPANETEYTAILAGQDESEKAWFRVAYKEEIGRLREAYGADKVTVEWAIFVFDL